MGIAAITGFANVINSGSITGTSGSGYGISAFTDATVTNNVGGSIAGGWFGIHAFAGGSSVFNAGTISGGTAAIQFAGIGNTLTLAQGSVISGNVLGTGNDIFQLGGTGAATFDVSQLGPAAQYRGFGTFNKIDSSVWTLTGTSTYAGPVNVNGGTLAVNGDIIVSERRHGQCRRHARRQRHRRQHHDQCRRHAGAGQFDRAAHRAGQPRVHCGVELLWSRSRPPMPTAPM